MSNPVHLLRDNEELEGTLLPIATEITPSTSSSGGGCGDNRHSNQDGPTARPINRFDYDTALIAEVVNEQQQQQQQQQYEQERIALIIPQRYDDRSLVSDVHDRSRIKGAQRMGLIASEEEREAIRKADNRGFVQSYYEREQIRLANEYAQQRDREGLQVRLEAWEQEQMARQAATAEVEDDVSTVTTRKDSHLSGGYQVGGYQVKEYDVSPYETSDYQTTEYKSVYDP